MADAPRSEDGWDGLPGAVCLGPGFLLSAPCFVSPLHVASVETGKPKMASPHHVAGLGILEQLGTVASLSLSMGPSTPGLPLSMTVSG